MSAVTDIENLNVSNIIFNDTFHRGNNKYITLGLQNTEDDSVNPLLLLTPNLYTNGVKEIFDRSRENVLAYNMMLSLWNKAKGATPEEKLFTDKVEEIYQYVISFLESIQEEMRIDPSLIENFKIIAWQDYHHPSSKKHDTQENLEDGHPLQPKLFCKLKQNKAKTITTDFFDLKTQSELNPYELINTSGLATCALEFTQLCINDRRITLEIRIRECLFSKFRPRNQYKNSQQKVKKSILMPEMMFDRVKTDKVEQVNTALETTTDQKIEEVQQEYIPSIESEAVVEE